MKKKSGIKIDGLTNFMDRIRHFYVDWLVIFTLSMLSFFFISKPMFFALDFDLQKIVFGTFFCVYLLYYSLLEYLFSFTLGKLMNRTRVFTLDGGKPSFIQIITRTIIRLIPFGFVFQFTPRFQCLHDMVSKTRVVRVK